MNPSTTYLSLFLLFTISLISISHAATSPPSNTKLYEVLCREFELKKYIHPCLKLLEPNPKITSAKDYLNLSKFILEMGIEKGKQSQHYFNEMAKKYPSSQASKWCATHAYNSFVASFHGSLGELVEDPVTANYDASVAADSPRDCQRVLDGDKIVDPSFSTLNNQMSLLSSIAGLATNHLIPNVM